MPEGTACKNKREKTNRLKCRMKCFVRFLKHVRFVFFCQGYPFKCWSAVGQYIMSKACFPGECFSQWTVSSALKLGKARPVWSQTDNKIWKMKYPSRFQVAVRQRFTWDCKSQKNSNVGIYLGFPSLMLNPGVFQAKISRLLRQLTKPREKLAPSMEKKKKHFSETLTGIRLMIKKPSQELMKGWTAKMSKPEPCWRWDSICYQQVLDTFSRSLVPIPDWETTDRSGFGRSFIRIWTFLNIQQKQRIVQWLCNSPLLNSCLICRTILVGPWRRPWPLKVIFSIVASNSLDTLWCNRVPKRSDFKPASVLEVLFVRWNWHLDVGRPVLQSQMKLENLLFLHKHRSKRQNSNVRSFSLTTRFWYLPWRHILDLPSSSELIISGQDA